MSAERVVLVTGAGRGLGRAICERFHADGNTVIATDIDRAVLSDLEGRDRLLTLALDVCDAARIQSLADQIAQQYGRLDVLVNNAGIMGYFPVAEMDPETLIKHFQINSFGALRMTHACLESLIVAGGRVINISSESYKLRTPFQIYQTTKLALEGISDVLRRELVHLRVHVATIRPGAIDTELFRAMQRIENPVANSRLADRFDGFAAMLKNNPPSRRSTPEQVAALVYRAATDTSPRAHYAINNMWSLKLMSGLPTAWADWLIRRFLG